MSNLEVLAAHKSLQITEVELSEWRVIEFCERVIYWIENVLEIGVVDQVKRHTFARALGMYDTFISNNAWLFPYLPSIPEYAWSDKKEFVQAFDEWEKVRRDYTMLFWDNFNFIEAEKSDDTLTDNVVNGYLNSALKQKQEITFIFIRKAKIRRLPFEGFFNFFGKRFIHNVVWSEVRESAFIQVDKNSSSEWTIALEFNWNTWNIDEEVELFNMKLQEMNTDSIARFSHVQ